MTFKLTKDLAQGVLCVVDAGLCNGLGVPKPGRMCVEAAVSFAMGENHNDHPSCVADSLSDIKIELNDQIWSSNKARAAGLRRLAVAQLGSFGKFDYGIFWNHVNLLLADHIRWGMIKKLKKLKAGKFDIDAVIDATRAGFSGAQDLRDIRQVLAETGTDFKGKNGELLFIAELYVQALIKMKIPGTRYLHLTKGKMNRKAVMAKVYRLRKAKGQHN